MVYLVDELRGLFYRAGAPESLRFVREYDLDLTGLEAADRANFVAGENGRVGCVDTAMGAVSVIAETGIAHTEGDHALIDDEIAVVTGKGDVFSVNAGTSSTAERSCPGGPDRLRRQRGEQRRLAGNPISVRGQRRQMGRPRGLSLT